MTDIYNKSSLCLTQHYDDSIKEYYRTECTGKVIEVTINHSNNITKKIINITELPKEILTKIFNVR